MATNTKTTKTAVVTVGTQWGSVTDAVMLDGVDLVDKETLEGKAFLITGIRNHVGNGDVLYAQIEATFDQDPETGKRFMFQDSGKGIRAQVDAYFEAIGKPGLLDEWHDCRIVAPKGLRVSPHIQEDERGRKVEVRSFYLTTSGRRR